MPSIDLNEHSQIASMQLAFARFHIFLEGTDHRAAIYKEDSLTTSLTNPVKADDAGRVPLVYLTQGSYRVVIEDARGQPLKTISAVSAQDPLQSNAPHAFGDLVALLGDTRLAYMPDSHQMTAVVGKRIAVGDSTYSIAPQDATDHQGVTSGGVKIYVDVASGRASGLIFAHDTGDTHVQMQALLNRMAAQGGGILELPPGNVRIGGRVKVPDATDLHGVGSTRVSGIGSTIVCTTPDAGLSYGGRHDDANPGGADPSFGSRSGYFIIDGQGIALQPFYVGRALNRIFSDIHILGGAQDDILIEETQNCIFEQVKSERAARYGMVIDRGAGGLQFNQCNINNSSDTAIVVKETWGEGEASGAYSSPQQILFVKLIAERTENGQVLDLQNCRDLTFISCDFASSGAPADVDLIKIDACYRIGFVKANFVGSAAYTTAFSLTNASTVFMNSGVRFSGFKQVFQADASCRIMTTDYNVSNISGAQDADAVTSNTVRSLFVRPLEVEIDPITNQRGLQVRRKGDIGLRAVINSDGSIGFGTGASGSPDTSFYRGGPGIIRSGGVFMGNGVGTGLMTSPPSQPLAGVFYTADGANWDPLGLGDGAYVVWWTGTEYRSLASTANGSVT